MQANMPAGACTHRHEVEVEVEGGGDEARPGSQQAAEGDKEDDQHDAHAPNDAALDQRPAGVKYEKEGRVGWQKVEELEV